MALGTSYHRVLASDSRSRLLEALRQADRPLSVNELAGLVELRPVTARFHLDLLVSAGLVSCTPAHRDSPGRPSLLYSAVTAGEDAPQEATAAEPGGTPPNEYEELARVLADQLSQTPDPASAGREAGRRWMRALEMAGDSDTSDPLITIVDLMTRLGFAPDLDPETNEIRLHRCPFEAVAREHRQIVCGVHQGMIEESLSRLGGKSRLSSFRPFVSDHPLLCTVRIEPVEEEQEPETR